MDYLDYELERYQYYQDTTCEHCGGCLEEEYFDCTCDDGEEEE